MSTLELSIDGMSCSGCSGRLQRVLEASDGIHSAKIALSSKHASIHYDPAIIDISAIHAAISDAGFSVIQPPLEQSPHPCHNLLSPTGTAPCP